MRLGYWWPLPPSTPPLSPGLSRKGHVMAQSPSRPSDRLYAAELTSSLTPPVSDQGRG